MIKTVGALKKILDKYPDDTPIAGYSGEGECDFYIEKVRVGTLDEDGIINYCCQGDSALPLGTKILVISGGSR